MKKKEIFSRYLIDHLFQFIYWRTKNKEDTEEILQETLKTAWQCLPLYSEKSSFFTWLCGIARHEIADYYRKKKIKTILFSYFPWLENLASESLGPEQEILKKEFLKKIDKTFNQLSEGYQQILRLKYIEGLTVKEIAKKLNETVKAIESRLFRARQAFVKAFTTDSS